MRVLAAVSALLLPVAALALPAPAIEPADPSVIIIRVPAQDVTRCNETLAAVMLVSGDGPIVAETENGPTTFRCEAE